MSCFALTSAAITRSKGSNSSSRDIVRPLSRSKVLKNCVSTETKQILLKNGLRATHPLANRAATAADKRKKKKRRYLFDHHVKAFVITIKSMALMVVSTARMDAVFQELGKIVEHTSLQHGTRGRNETARGGGVQEWNLTSQQKQAA